MKADLMAAVFALKFVEMEILGYLNVVGSVCHGILLSG
ncbi:hypothetical protein SAMN05192546_106149 [Tindallia californiensis]|uniref:Uncharacterized protein n=1 Tax=Tindallia californiensis TaxID=159292 RepID=A0A1H3PDB3_9FIRM|nr:hypothetical protein SAMN05192546_106149 [Tindallia californiensis]